MIEGMLHIFVDRKIFNNMNIGDPSNPSPNESGSGHVAGVRFRKEFPA